MQQHVVRQCSMLQSAVALHCLTCSVSAGRCSFSTAPPALAAPVLGCMHAASVEVEQLLQLLPSLHWWLLLLVTTALQNCCA